MPEHTTAPVVASQMRSTEYVCGKGWPEVLKETKLTRDFSTSVDGAVSAGHFASVDALLNAAYGQLKIKAGHAAQKFALETVAGDEKTLGRVPTADELNKVFRETVIGAPRARGEGKPKGPNAGLVKEAREIKANAENALTAMSPAELKTALKFNLLGPDTETKVNAELARRKTQG